MRYLRACFLLCMYFGVPVLLAATLAVWTRSYFWGDYLAIHRREPQGQDSCGVVCVTAPGECGVWYFRYVEQVTPRAIWHVGRSTARRDTYSGVLDDFSRGSGRRFYFSFERTSLGRHTDIYARASLWAIALALGVTTGLTWYPGVRRWCRQRRGRFFFESRCAVCGYDLRATPTRCPECGTPPAIPGGCS